MKKTVLKVAGIVALAALTGLSIAARHGEDPPWDPADESDPEA